MAILGLVNPVCGFTGPWRHITWLHWALEIHFVALLGLKLGLKDTLCCYTGSLIYLFGLNWASDTLSVATLGLGYNLLWIY